MRPILHTHHTPSLHRIRQHAGWMIVAAGALIWLGELGHRVAAA